MFRKRHFSSGFTAEVPPVPVVSVSKPTAAVLAEAEDAEKNSIDGEGFGGVQRAQAKRALFGDQAGVEKEGDKLVPREVVGRGRGVGKIERESTGDQRHRRTAIGSHEAASPLTNP